MFVKYVGPHPIAINDPSTEFQRFVDIDDVFEVPGDPKADPTAFPGTLAARLLNRGDFVESERPKPLSKKPRKEA